MPDKPLRLFILAGEPSGDRLGAALVERLRETVPVELTGIGGDHLVGQGLAPLYPMHDLSVMGFADVARRLPLLLWRARQTVRAILKSQPEIVVLVDSQVFSAVIAKRLRRAGYRGRIVLYVAPAVWAWKPERAAELQPLFDLVLAVLPFEPEAMARLGGPPTVYVGHPARRRLPFRVTPAATGPLLLLPGSRLGEIRRTLPMLAAGAAEFARHPRVEGLVLPTPPALLADMQAATRDWPVPVEVISAEAEILAAFARAVAAVAVTGTVTLELALAGVPTISTYVADAGQAKRFARYKVKHVALPNIILDAEVVPELLFTAPDVGRLTAAVSALLDEPERGAAQVDAFRELRTLMENGTAAVPVMDAAAEVLRLRP